MNIIKKLPKIYQNDIDKKFSNNEEIFYSFSDSSRNVKMNYEDISIIINGIFNGEHQVYNIPVIIKTSSKVYDTYVIARTNNYLLTIDRDKININDIISIKRKNP